MPFTSSDKAARGTRYATELFGVGLRSKVAVMRLCIDK